MNHTSFFALSKPHSLFVAKLNHTLIFAVSNPQYPPTVLQILLVTILTARSSFLSEPQSSSYRTIILARINLTTRYASLYQNRNIPHIVLLASRVANLTTSYSSLYQNCNVPHTVLQTLLVANPTTRLSEPQPSSYRIISFARSQTYCKLLFV